MFFHFGRFYQTLFGLIQVADLKSMLKARNLSTVGNKTELKMRLEQSLLASEVGDASKLDDDEELDEDAILGDDDDDLGDDDGLSFNDKSVDESLLHTEEMLLGETLNESQDASPPPRVAPVTESRSKPSANSEASELKTGNGQTSSSALANKEPVKVSEIFASIDTTVLTPEERKKLRALKFGDPKKLSRAERFGTLDKVSCNARFLLKITKFSSLFSQAAIIPESDKLIKRVQRFGEAVSAKAKTLEEQARLVKRRERFGVVTPATEASSTASSVVDDKILARQERFGVVTPAAKTSRTAATSSPSVDDEKISARQERFGVVAKPVAKSSNGPLRKNFNKSYNVS